MPVPKVPYVKGLYTPTKQQSRIRHLLPKGHGIRRGEVPYSSNAIHFIINQNAANPGAGPLAVNRKKGAPNAKGVMRGVRVSATPSGKPIYRGGSLDRQAQQVKRENRGANKEQLKKALNKRVSYLRKGRK